MYGLEERATFNDCRRDVELSLFCRVSLFKKPRFSLHVPDLVQNCLPDNKMMSVGVV